MKLVVATPLYPPEPGGPATYAKLLEDELPKRGVEVSLVKFSEVRHLPTFFRHVAYGQRVRAAVRDADAVLALDPVSTGYPAMLAARRAGKPFYVKVVGDYAWEQGRQRFGIHATLDEFVRMNKVPLPVQFLRDRQRAVAKAAVRVIVPSNYLKRIVMTWGIPEEKIVVIHNAVTLEEGTSYPAVEALPHPRIVCAARLVPWKGIDGLIDAVAQMRAQGTAASLVIVGDGPERQSLETRAKEKLSDGYLFLGALSHGDTIAAMKSAHIFALNTSYEGLSHVLIEALMLGLPIVTTPVGGNSELTEDGVNALWVSPGNVEQLAQALTRLIRDTGFAAQLGRNAKAKAQEFTPAALADALMKGIVSP